jgi:hypothetical protein
MKNVFEAVKTPDGWEVKTQIRKNGQWYTAADTHCIPGFLDAKEMAESIAFGLNARLEWEVQRRGNRKKKKI